jgi:type III restriction enzyme
LPIGAILYEDRLARAAEKIKIACTRGSDGRDRGGGARSVQPQGSTRHVNFITSKACGATGARRPKCQISHVVLDSSWEEQLALMLENQAIALQNCSSAPRTNTLLSNRVARVSRRKQTRASGAV